MKCPACGGSEHEVIGPDQFRCLGSVAQPITRQLLDVVPPGVAGNGTGAGVPLYGPTTGGGVLPCARVYSKWDSDNYEQRWSVQLDEQERLRKAEAEIRAVADPCERYVRAAARYLDVQDVDVEAEGGRRRSIPSTARSAGNLRFQQFCTETDFRGSDDAVAAWFSRAASGALDPDLQIRWPLPVTGPFSHKRLGDVRTKPGPLVNAWSIPSMLLSPVTVAPRADALISERGDLHVGWVRSGGTGDRSAISRPAQLTNAALVFLAGRLGYETAWLSSTVPAPQRG